MDPSPSPSYRTPLVLLALALASCKMANTEEGRLHLSLKPLFYSEAEPFDSGARALLGSRACAKVEGYTSEELDGWGSFLDDDWRSCYDATWSGGAAADPCTTLGALGEHTVEIVPRDDCFVDEIPNHPPDRFRLQVIPIDGLRGRLEWAQERLAEQYLHPGPRGSFPRDWFPAVDEPLQLVPDVEVGFPVVLVDESGELVAWDRDQGRVLESRAGEAPRELRPSDELLGFPVRIGAGERSTLSLALPDAEVPVAEVIATPADEAASIEVVVAYHPGDERETTHWSAPMAARALVRDAEGRVILGAPVEWTLLEGHLSLIPGMTEITDGPPEYLTVEDACVPRPNAPERRHATLRATLGALSHEVALEWTAMPDESPSDEPFVPHEACQHATADDDGLEDRGCGCTTRPSGAAGWLAWGVVALGVGRRRRRGTSRARVIASRGAASHGRPSSRCVPAARFAPEGRWPSARSGRVLPCRPPWTRCAPP